MSYLAFDLDALKRVPDASRAAGITEAELGYGLVRLWSWCWNEKTDAANTAHLRGFFGGDTQRVAEALCAFRFLELSSGGGFRVRGADRYLRIHKARSDGGKAASANLKQGALKPGASSEDSRGAAPATPRLEPGRSPGYSPALTPSTEHRAPSTEEENNTVEQARPGPATEVFLHWKAVMGKPRAVLDDKRRRVVNARLAEGRTLAELKRAIDGCRASAWHMGTNDRGRPYNDLELICRDAKHLEEFLAMADSPPSGDWRDRADYAAGISDDGRLL